MTLQALLGIAAGLLQLVASGVYVGSILVNETKPNRITWWVLALVSGMITASYWSTGARETIWLPASYTASFLLIAFLSIRYGDGPITLSGLDRVSLAGALLSAVVWWSLGSPVPALFMSICTECIGLIPTVAKSYRDPGAESKASWYIATLASLLNVLALTDWSVIMAAYPLYVFVTNSMIALLISRKKAA